jgi:hypothetical protein
MVKSRGSRSPAESPPLVEALLSADAYPHPARDLRFVETHISWVFLAGEFVYKVRRPVRFGFVDFSTLEKRRHDCAEELRLNRRLAPDVYLRVARVTSDDGVIAIDGRGRTVDHAVAMRRLPARSFFDAMLADGRARPMHIRRLAADLAASTGPPPPDRRSPASGDRRGSVRPGVTTSSRGSPGLAASSRPPRMRRYGASYRENYGDTRRR